MAQTLINVRMDENLKRQFDFICEELGMNMTTAITIFAKKVCREKRIPFEVSIMPEYGKDTYAVKNKTYYRVKVWLDLIGNDGVYKSNVECFEVLSEALEFIDEKNEELRNNAAENGDMDAWNCDIGFSLEFVNSDKDVYDYITCDAEGFKYVHDGVYENIGWIEDGQEWKDIISGYVKALEMMHKL